jgi:type II secretory pathway predicted ATPase ExeA
MYNSHFGFNETPFSISPNPRFFYDNAVYREAYASLRYGIEAKMGFVAVTSEVGTGKTTLLRKLMRDLKTTIHSVFIFNPLLNFDEFIRKLLADLGLPANDRDKLAMLEQLNGYLIEQFEKDHIVCVLIDEAQQLSDESLEALRLLSNLETDSQKLLQIVLVGQPELDARLEQPNLRQLKQRIAVRCKISPLSDHEVEAYIRFRLQVAGYSGKDLFEPEAIKLIALYSRGLPRTINILCDGALVIAYAGLKKTVSDEMVREVAAELRLHGTPDSASLGQFSPVLPPNRVANEPSSWSTETRLTLAFLVGVLISALVFVIIVFIGRHVFKSARDQANPPNLQGKVVTTDAKGPSHSTQKLPVIEPAEPASDRQKTERTLTVRYGSTVFQIAEDVYGDNVLLGVDLIKEFNPQIRNLNLIYPGQRLVVPRVTKETLIRRQSDKSYTVIVGCFLDRKAAETFARRLLPINHAVVIVTNRLSNDLVVFRLEVDGLKTWQDAVTAVDGGVQGGWLKLDKTDG